MAGNEHLLFVREAAFGTWLTPTKTLPVREAGVSGGQPLMQPNVTGGGRNDFPGAVGELSADGPVSTLLYPMVLPEFLRSIFTTRAKVAAGAGWKNKLLINDDVAQSSYSMQKRYDASRAESLRGMKVSKVTISARTKEHALIALEFVGKESVMHPSGLWADGSAAPIVVDPVPAYPTVDAFTFYQGILRLGGTTALTAGEIVVTSGVDKVDFDNIELVIDTSLGTDGYGVNLGDRTRQTIDEGARAITFKFDPNWANSSSTYYNAWKNGAKAVVELFFQGPEFEAGQRYQMKFTLPDCRYDAGANPAVNRTFGLKRHSVSGVGYSDRSLTGNPDIGLVVQSTEDLTL